MADRKFFTPEEQQQIILAALNSLTGTQMTSREDLDRRVIKRALTIQDLLREDSACMRTLGSVRIYAHVDSVEFEEKSQRYIVRFTSKKLNDNGEPPKQEHVRTPQMTSSAGKMIRKTVEHAAGHDAIIFKYNEPAPEGAQRGDDPVPTQGYRIMPWIEILN